MFILKQLFVYKFLLFLWRFRTMTVIPLNNIQGIRLFEDMIKALTCKKHGNLGINFTKLFCWILFLYFTCRNLPDPQCRKDLRYKVRHRSWLWLHNCQKPEKRGKFRQIKSANVVCIAKQLFVVPKSSQNYFSCKNSHS